MLIIQDLDQINILEGFPEKGSAVIGYFVDRGGITGHFYVAIVEESGRMQYRLRWSDSLTEIFKSIKGKNTRYQYFYLLGYVSMNDYQQYRSDGFRNINDISRILYQPSSQVISAHRNQAKEIREIKKRYHRQISDIPNKILGGQQIVFLYVRGIDEPIIVEGGFSRVFDGYVYVNIDENLESTDNDDDYLYVPNQYLLSVGAGHS